MVDIASLYAKHSIRFDRARFRDLIERRYLDFVLERVKPNARVLDVGCGTGEPLAKYFIDQGCQVTGVDFVEEMLELCRSRFPTMCWLKMDMRELELSDTFHVVMAWDSFFHLSRDDQRLTLPKFRQHTAPRGVLIFTSGPRDGEEVGGDMFGDQLFHASLSPEEYRAVLAGLGYEVVLHREEDPECGGHTVWVAQLTEASMPALREPPGA